MRTELGLRQRGGLQSQRSDWLGRDLRRPRYARRSAASGWIERLGAGVGAAGGGLLHRHSCRRDRHDVRSAPFARRPGSLGGPDWRRQSLDRCDLPRVSPIQSGDRGADRAGSQRPTSGASVDRRAAVRGFSLAERLTLGRWTPAEQLEAAEAVFAACPPGTARMVAPLDRACLPARLSGGPRWAPRRLRSRYRHGEAAAVCALGAAAFAA